MRSLEGTASEGGRGMRSFMGVITVGMLRSLDVSVPGERDEEFGGCSCKKGGRGVWRVQLHFGRMKILVDAASGVGSEEFARPGSRKC